MADPALPPFYDPPAPLPPGPPGGLLRTEPLAAPAGVRGRRILYRSATRAGDPIAVSGMLLTPDASPPSGGFPLLSVAHGTSGVNRACAPSLDPAAGGPHQVSAFDVLAPYVRAGYAVVATDYQGLGAPGPPAYLDGVVEGRNVLDAARAARALPDLPLAAGAVILGHSQGGHAAAFAGQLAAVYAPEQRIDGVVLLAPAAELEIMALGLALLPEPVPASAFIVMAMYAWSLSYPGVRLDDVLTEAGMASLAVVRSRCGPAVYPAFESAPPDHFFNPVGVALSHAWRSIVAENVPGHDRTAAPILVAQGLADTVIPPVTTRLFVHRLRRLGDRVELKTYPDADHLTLVEACRADVLAWIGARAAR